jgi:8-oxo-dGTP pyrophosphatase MutT (NUDIX family)
MISVIRERLKSYNAKRVECASTIMAGVVIPLFEKDSDFFFLLTKRSDTVRFHRGEVSFPGGMYEEADGNIMNTALRECGEEIGVKRDDMEIIGRLDDVYTLTGFVITPYVGIIPYPYEFRTNPEEVAYIITLPYALCWKLQDTTGRPKKCNLFTITATKYGALPAGCSCNFRKLSKMRAINP